MLYYTKEGDRVKQCSLCGGKLDNNKRCTFCGLDNTKNDDQYKYLLNENDCKHAPLTYDHEESQKKKYPSAKYNGGNYKRAITKVTAKKKDSKGAFATIVSIITIIGAIVGITSSIAEDYNYQSHEEIHLEEERDPYAYVIDDMPEDGEFYEVTLEPGMYKVGMDIPLGRYEAENVMGDSGYVKIQDNRNGIFLSEDIGYDEQERVSDLRLYDDAYFIVSPNVIVKIYTKNAQNFSLEGQVNPLTQSVVITEELIAGEDFEAGVYDIVYQPTEETEYGSVEYVITDEEGYEYEWSLYFDSGMGSQTFHNLLLPEDAVVTISDLESVTLVPSKTIESTDYDKILESYY